MEETYLSAYVFKYGIERLPKQNGGIDGITSRMMRDASGGIRVEADVSPEGLIWIDDQNFNTWLKPKIGQCQADGSFKIVKEAPENVRPRPLLDLSEPLGVCTADRPEGARRQDRARTSSDARARRDRSYALAIA